jgi:hypothetical protein
MTRRAQSSGLQLTRRLRAELLGIDGVTDALLDAAWPSIEFIGERVRQEPGARLADLEGSARAVNRRRAGALAALREVLADEDAVRLIGRVLVQVYGHREADIARANDFLSKLASEAAADERQARKGAAPSRRRVGRAAQVLLYERLLITELEVYWVKAHGKAPATSEHSGFIKLAELLGGELGLDVTRNKVRTALGGNKRSRTRVMPPSKGDAKSS